MFSFGLSSIISMFFAADFEHVFVCWKRYSLKTIAVPNTLPSKQILTQSSGGNLKTRGEIC